MLEQLHVELNSEHSQHLSSISNYTICTLTSTYPCGVPARHDADNVRINWGEPEQAPPSVAAGRNVCLSICPFVPCTSLARAKPMYKRAGV